MPTKTNHTTIRNGNLFCTHCGGEKKIVLPIAITEYTQAIDDFNKLHKKCKKVWTEPTIQVATTTLKERMAFWLEHGERGVSSETIFEVITGQKLRDGKFSHPHDPGDLYRCYKLLLVCPEFNRSLGELSKVSPQWKILVENWKVLIQMLEENVNSGIDNGLYDFMQHLIEKQ